MKVKNTVSKILSVIALLCVISLFSVYVFKIHLYHLNTDNTSNISKGSLIVSYKEAFEEIETNDIITYTITNSSTYVTSQVSDISEENRMLCIGVNETRSIAEYIDYDTQYEATMLFSLPLLGYVLAFVQSPAGNITAVIGLLILVGIYLFDKYKDKIRSIK